MCCVLGIIVISYLFSYLVYCFFFWLKIVYKVIYVLWMGKYVLRWYWCLCFINLWCIIVFILDLWVYLWDYKLMKCCKWECFKVVFSWFFWIDEGVVLFIFDWVNLYDWRLFIVLRFCWYWFYMFVEYWFCEIFC